MVIMRRYPTSKCHFSRMETLGFFLSTFKIWHFQWKSIPPSVNIIGWFQERITKRLAGHNCCSFILIPEILLIKFHVSVTGFLRAWLSPLYIGGVHIAWGGTHSRGHHAVWTVKGEDASLDPTTNIIILVFTFGRRSVWTDVCLRVVFINGKIISYR